MLSAEIIRVIREDHAEADKFAQVTVCTIETSYFSLCNI